MDFLVYVALALLYSYFLCVFGVYRQLIHAVRYDWIEIVCMVILPPIIWFKIGRALFIAVPRMPRELAAVFSFLAAFCSFFTVIGLEATAMHSDFRPVIWVQVGILWFIVPLIMISAQFILQFHRRVHS